MVRRSAPPAHLSKSEAACLDAVRSGTDTRTRIALQARLDLEQADVALDRLASVGLLQKRERRWCVTPRGKSASISIAPDPEPRRGGTRRGEIQPGSAPDRLLALLAQPQHGADLIAKLGVSRQHVHQSVVRLAALGLIRTGEADRPIYAVARSDDPSILLRASEETVLSVFPETAATTAANVARASRRTSEEAASIMRVLIDHGLVEPAGQSRRGEVYRLTPAGRAHWQRRPIAQTADLPALPVRSDRVRLVLSHLAQHGPARTHSVGQALGIPRLSMNGLMQYLKRKGLVRKTSMDLHAPHELTSEGKETLQAMLT